MPKLPKLTGEEAARVRGLVYDMLNDLYDDPSDLDAVEIKEMVSLAQKFGITPQLLMNEGEVTLYEFKRMESLLAR